MAFFLCISAATYLVMTKSLMSVKGSGSCWGKVLSSNSIMLLLVGMYSEHMLIAFCRVTDTTIACRFVFIWLCGIVLFTIIDVPSDTLIVFIRLCIVCCLMFNLLFSFKKKFLGNITLGHMFLMISVSSSRLAFVPLMFHCMIFFF